MEDLNQFVPNVHFEKIPIKNLVSNQKYQRNLSQSHIARAAANFDLYQINPVKVSRRDGVNYVFNGQHTIEIVALVSGSRDTPVWCMIYEELVYEHEADIFANQQKFVKPLSPYEVFLANLEAGNDDQLIIRDLVESCADRNGKIETILRCVTLLCNERCDQVSKRFAGADFRFADGDLFSGEPKVHVLAEFDLILTNGESILGKDRAEDGFNRFQRIVDDYIQIPFVACVFDGVKHHRRHAVITAGIEEIVFSSAGNLGAVSRHAVQGDIPCGVFDKEMIDDKPSFKGEVVNGSVVGFIRVYEVLQRIAVVICDFKHVEDPPSLGVFGSRMVCRSVTAPAQ